jgi:hypothetical protein
VPAAGDFSDDTLAMEKKGTKTVAKARIRYNSKADALGPPEGRGENDERGQTMNSEAGNPKCPIWLLADSEPDRWRDRLVDPLDARHPIRHNIWTSMLEVVQGEVFLALGKRLDADQFYVRNAWQDPATKEAEPFQPTIFWEDNSLPALTVFERLLTTHKARIVMTFGAPAFAFALHAAGEGCTKLNRTSTASALLGCEFRRRAAGFDITRTNILPLQHRSIAGGNFLAGHEEFCGREGANYFEEVGKVIAGIMVRHADALDCWLRRPARLAPTQTT